MSDDEDDDLDDSDVYDEDEEFVWEERDKALEALKDVLPTKEEFEQYVKDTYGFKPTERLMADESQVYALINGKTRYGRESLVPFLIAERFFAASCSSCWGWGLRRYPNCQVDESALRGAEPGGMCDPFDEWTHDELRHGIELAKKRVETGFPQPAARFGIIVMDLHAAYGGGWQITDEFFRRLEVFREETSGCHFNQRGYEVLRRHDDHAVLILPDKPHDYDKYLLDHLKELHRDAGGICLGVSVGDVYFWKPDEIFSEAINRLWLEMKNMPSGGIYLDGVEGAKVAGRIGLGDRL